MTTRTAHRARPTMHDVALAAGVSVKTVSRVVNGVDYVSAETLQVVNAAIDELGFRRNEFARQLRQGTTATIGLVIEDIGDPFYSVLIRAVEDVALARGYTLLAASSAESAERSRRLIESFTSRGVDGLIVVPASGTDVGLLRSEIETGCTMVFVDRPAPGLPADTVLVDNRGGAMQGAAHLIAHGHHRIAYFGDDEALFTAAERRDGFLDAFAAAGLDVDPALTIMTNPHPESSQHEVDRVLDAAEPPTAVMTGNNRWSVRALRTLRARGLSADMAFLGFDDFELGDLLTPGATVIAQDPAAMGRTAAELLLRRIEGLDDGPHQHIRLSTSLIERGSGELPGPFATR
ncbi:LacI family DNA-binding transcriptional regulator [Agromyces sp. NPDC056379]|uniref:LacI family DNA-binding transcriptional regulator n=1 Tax=unclassified Agromyces TaxID=2639701 RepID=UPI0035DC48DB